MEGGGEEESGTAGRGAPSRAPSRAVLSAAGL